MKKLRSNATDMTSGRPHRLLFLFTAPLLLGNVFQQLYNMVDSIVVGNFIGEKALAAVGTGFPHHLYDEFFIHGIEHRRNHHDLAILRGKGH